MAFACCRLEAANTVIEKSGDESRLVSEYQLAMCIVKAVRAFDAAYTGTEFSLEKAISDLFKEEKK